MSISTESPTGYEEFDSNVAELEGGETANSTIGCTGDCTSTSCGGSRACD